MYFCTMLEILYQDNYLVAINKPHGLLVHQSPIARDASEFAIQLLRDQIGLKVFLYIVWIEKHQEFYFLHLIKKQIKT